MSGDLSDKAYHDLRLSLLELAKSVAAVQDSLALPG
jgi:hypothetical protein